MAKDSVTTTICTGVSKGQRGMCKWPVLEGMELFLCPTHLRMAAEEIEELGGVKQLEVIMRKQRA